MSKHVCNCGQDLVESGVLIEGSDNANYNEKDDNFIVEFYNYESKCPNCFGLVSAQVVEAEKQQPSRYILIPDTSEVYIVSSDKECVETIIKEYHKHSASMYDVLDSVEIKGFSVQAIANIYAECMSRSDSDTIVHFRDEFDITDFENYEIMGL